MTNASEPVGRRHDDAGELHFGFPDRLRKARLIAGMTQKQFAEALGVKDVAQWEAGNNRPRDIVAIAKRVQIITKGRAPATWLLEVADLNGGGGGSELPRLDSNQQPFDRLPTLATYSVTRLDDWRNRRAS